MATLERDEEANEASVEAIKRQKLYETFQLKYSALRKVGEKLNVVGGYGEVLVQPLAVPRVQPYGGKDRSALVREKVEEELNAWSSDRPRIPLPVLSGVPSALHRDTYVPLHSFHPFVGLRIKKRTGPLV